MDEVALDHTWNAAGKDFCVRNIPNSFVDWDLFRIFYKYGTVHNVKIPPNQTQSNSKYGFVIMESLSDAARVQSHLRNGKYLITDNGLQLLVGPTRNDEVQNLRDDGGDYCNNKNSTPSRKLKITGSVLPQKKFRTGRGDAPKVYELCGAVKCLSQDLPLRTATKVRVVDSPQPCRCVEDGFVFHIIPIDQELGEEYTVLQQEMNNFCMKNPNLEDPPKVGQYALFGRANVAYRALCNSDKTMYLVDTGEIVPIKLSQLWNIDNAFTKLPSLVVPCGISEITWTKPSTVVFNNYRNVLKRWSDSCVNGLTVTATRYSGLVNMIHLETFSDEACLRTKGFYTRLSPVQHHYPRHILLHIRNSFKVWILCLVLIKQRYIGLPILYAIISYYTLFIFMNTR